MLLDIIPMVDRWKESNRRVDCSTFSQICVEQQWNYIQFPVGMEERYFPVGREFDDYETHQYRYKIIEQVGKYLIEYLVISWDPINLLAITKNKGTEIIPIWAKYFNVADKRSVRVHYFTDNICDILNEVWVMPSMHCDTNTVREAYLCELDRVGEQYNLPDLRELVDEQRNKFGMGVSVIPSNEDKDIDKFFDLGRVLSPLYWDNGALCYPWVRDSICNTNWSIPAALDNSYYTDKILRHRIDLDSIRPMLDNTYCMHGFTRPIPAAFELSSEVVTNFGDDVNNLVYGLGKFIEEVPYTEFKIKGIYDKWEALFCNFYFERNMGHLVYDGKVDTDVFPRLVFNNVMRQLSCIAAGLDSRNEVKEMILIRSFNEDVYITITYKNGKVIRLYSDMVFSTLGSRGIFTDYECSWFN